MDGIHPAFEKSVNLMLNHQEATVKVNTINTFGGEVFVELKVLVLEVLDGFLEA